MPRPDAIATALTELEERGWAIVPCDAPDLLARVADDVKRIAAGIAGSRAGDDLRGMVSGFSPSELNRLLREVNNALAEDGLSLLEPFRGMIRSLCGDQVLYQRRPYLRANVPGLAHTATEPHSDVFYGHSPYAYTMWIPLHDVDNDDGLFVFDRAESEDILADYGFDKPLRAALDRPAPAPLRLRFGEAIFFSCYLIHGALPCSGSLPRLSLDTRVQAAKAPLFEKGAELYGLVRS
ncbi:hypothetical protein FZ029_07670 [Azospirillum sp. Sh1]|nr:hypothetical protein FZ029_07670 [Azospirillum sp. Sh1]